jgi:outer membrane immunogenic protein
MTQAQRILARGFVAGAILAATPAAAAGLMSSASEPVTWGGFYAGGQIGGAWSDTDWRYNNANWFNTLGPEIVITGFDMDGSGFLGGGQAGFNYQSGVWVFGVEGSIAGTDLNDGIPSPFFPASDRYDMDISWLATVTGRVGYAHDRWLVYGKGGWAGADVELTLFDRGTPVRANSDSWANGWTVGGGAEYAFGKLSLALEYAYAELDTGGFTVACSTCPGGTGGGVHVVDSDSEIQSVTARVNYRFGK